MSALSDFFSEKQLTSIRESDLSINIWEGSIRSGKTHASLWRFVDEASRGPAGDFAIVTRTYDSFERNILPELQKIMGNHVRYFRGKRQLFIKQRKCHVITADDASAEAKIRGCTLAGAYVDEVTIIPENVFIMLIGRLSIEGSKLFGTTNPDSPYHWFKVWMENNPDLRAFKFIMDDNPSMSEERKEFYKRQFKGLWYQRFILGKWVQAEGAIYDFFDEKMHVIDFPLSTATSYIVGIDYGTTNPCAFVLVGINKHRYPNLWVEDEYYFNSRVTQRQKTDAEYAEDLKVFIENRAISAIYLDPSAASFRAELIRSGIDNITDAENDVIDGIRFVAKLLNQGTFKICRKCRNMIAEFQSYVWDEKSLKSGLDKPKKENDHCFAAGTMIATHLGQLPIEELKQGQLVLTSEGYKPILKTWIHEAEVLEYSILGINYICTDSHKFYTLNRGFIEVSNLLESDIFIVNLEQICLKPLNGMEQYSRDIQKLKHLLTGTITEDGLEGLAAVFSIVSYGSSIMEKFHEDTIFITKTGIPQTMTLAISNVLALENIANIMRKILQPNSVGFSKITHLLSGPKQPDGISPKKGEDGIQNMQKDCGRRESLSNVAADNATSCFSQKIIENDFVQINVNQNGEEMLVLTMSKKTASFALNHFSQTNTQKSNVVQNLAEKKPLGIRSVYNLTVQDKHEFYANGILVSNCLDALRYALYSHFFLSEQGGLSAKDIDRNYNQANGIQDDLPPFFQQPNNPGNFPRGF